MKFLLGLAICSAMLTKGLFIVTPPPPMVCETCTTNTTVTCSGSDTICSPNIDSCYTLLLETKKGTSSSIFTKGCITAISCAKLKRDAGKVISAEYGHYPDDAIIKKVECTKIVVLPDDTVPGNESSNKTSPNGSVPFFPGSSASLLLAIFGSLMKLVF